jgi:O-antigen/teichoic acid export membrane protein
MAMIYGVEGRIRRAVVAGALGQATNLVGRLALVPLFLNTWGAELYGEWLMASALMAMLAMSDFGGGVYFVNRLTELWVIGEHDKFLSILSSSIAMFILLPFGFFVLFAGLALTLPLADWMGLVVVRNDTLLLVLLLLGLQVCIAIPQGLLLGVYRAIGAQATSIMLGNGMLLGQLGLSFVVLINGGGVIALAVSQLIPVTMLLCWILYDLCINRLRQPVFKLALVRFSILREAFMPSMHFFSIRLAQALVIQGSVIIVGRVLGATEAALFSTLRMIINLVMKLSGLLSHAAWPEFTKLAVVEEKENMQQLHLLIFRGSIFFLVLYIWIVEVGGEQLFYLWIGDQLTYDANVMRAFGWYIVVTVSWTLSANLLMATNRHEKLAKWQLMAGSVGLGFCVIGATYYGLIGVVIGLLIGEGVTMWWAAASEVSIAPWGITRDRQFRELLIVLIATFLIVWPLLGLLAVCWVGLRALNAFQRRNILHW